MNGCVPINPFMSFDYFLIDVVSRDTIRQANNTYVHIADEIWTFGVISDGVLAEIHLAQELCKRIKYFALHNTVDSIKEIKEEELEYEKQSILKG